MRKKQERFQIQSEEDKRVKGRRAAVKPNKMCLCRGNIQQGCFQSKEEPEPNMIQYDSDADANSVFVVGFVEKKNVSSVTQKEIHVQ